MERENMDIDEKPVIAHSEKRKDGTHVIYINGNIICNLSGTCVREEIDKALQEDKPRIVLNIRDVRYLDSYSFGYLAKASKQAKEKGGNLSVSNANMDVANVIRMMHFDKAVPVYETEDEAVEKVRSE